MANPFPSSNHAETCIIPVTIYCINIWWEADLQGGGGENVKIYMRVRPLWILPTLLSYFDTVTIIFKYQMKGLV